ncbi:MAG TPA: hypothetical protein VK576_05850 [Thermoleophilia bacterium]|nr:hypothetical protein [Thermoleophilia bacterium]
MAGAAVAVVPAALPVAGVVVAAAIRVPMAGAAVAVVPAALGVSCLVPPTTMLCGSMLSATVLSATVLSASMLSGSTLSVGPAVVGTAMMVARRACMVPLGVLVASAIAPRLGVVPAPVTADRAPRVMALATGARPRPVRSEWVVVRAAAGLMTGVARRRAARSAVPSRWSARPAGPRRGAARPAAARSAAARAACAGRVARRRRPARAGR